MKSPQVPNKGEFILLLLKFALVLYFTSSGPWYQIVKGEVTGLFPTLLWAGDEISSFFIGHQNDNDPIGLCRYWLEGQELLTPRELNSHVSPTTSIGSHKLKLTIWDLLDCKLVNYLNLGSCNYSLGGMISAWIFSAALFAGGTGFLLSIVSIIYLFMLLLVIFKFAHVFILAGFLISILVITSPIFICFALFEPTKNFFQSWMRMIIGYILYPTLLFSFLSLMLVTFDAIYFGKMNLDSNNSKQPFNILEACEGVDSIYCTTAKAVNANPCDISIGTISERLTEKHDLGPFGKYTRLKPYLVDVYLPEMMKLMLFVVLFYFFHGAVVSFLGVLTGVHYLSDQARGSLNLATPFRKAGGLIVDKATHLTAKGLGKLSAMRVKR
jgi:type IV secretion system protein VirB6